MGTNASTLLLAAITAAVTPVVLISTCAALLISITNKQMILGNQIRSMTAECRGDGTPEPRRASIRAQLRHLRTRFGHVARSQVWLYAASCCFVFTVLSLTLGNHVHTSPQWARPTLYTFEGGILLMLGAVIEQFLETRQARRTMDLEMGDILGLAPPPIPRAGKETSRSTRPER